MKTTLKLFLLSLFIISCGSKDEVQQLPFDSFNFSYRIGDHSLNQNDYYFISEVGQSSINRRPIESGYLPDECTIETELTESNFFFTCDCSVPYDGSTLDYIIRMKSNREDSQLEEAFISFPQYNVSYNWVDNSIYSNNTVQGDEFLKMATVSNPVIENGGNPVSLSINYTRVLEP